MKVCGIKVVGVIMVLMIAQFTLLAQSDAVRIKSAEETTGEKITRILMTTSTGSIRARVLITQADLAFDTTTGVLILPSTTYATAGCIRYEASNGTLQYYDGSNWQTVSTGAASLPAGTAGQTLRHDGTSWVANSTLFNNGTNVGIGTTTPAYKLDVIGSLRATGPAVLGPDTTATGTLRFMELSANGPNFVSFKASDNIAADVVWTLPSSTGSAGQVLSVDANGVLSWVTPSGGAPGAYLVFTRAKIASNSSDADKDAAVQNEFGTNYVAATALEVAAYFENVSLPSTEKFCVAGEPYAWYIVPPDTTPNPMKLVADPPPPPGNPYPSVFVAGIRKDAPLRFTRGKIASNSIDADKDNLIQVTEASILGTSYRAATALNVACYFKYCQPPSTLKLGVAVSNFAWVFSTDTTMQGAPLKLTAEPPPPPGASYPSVYIAAVRK